MNSAIKNASRTFKIALPEDMAQQVDEFSRSHGWTIDEIFRIAYRNFQIRMTEIDRELNEPINPDDPESMTMAQVNALVHETRREERELKTA